MQMDDLGFIGPKVSLFAPGLLHTEALKDFFSQKTQCPRFSNNSTSTEVGDVQKSWLCLFIYLLFVGLELLFPRFF